MLISWVICLSVIPFLQLLLYLFLLLSLFILHSHHFINYYREIEVAAQREQRVRDMARRTHPKSNGDFAVLYNELDQWRNTEMHKIKVKLGCSFLETCLTSIRCFFVCFCLFLRF